MQHLVYHTLFAVQYCLCFELHATLLQFQCWLSKQAEATIPSAIACAILQFQCWLSKQAEAMILSAIAYAPQVGETLPCP